MGKWEEPNQIETQELGIDECDNQWVRTEAESGRSSGHVAADCTSNMRQGDPSMEPPWLGLVVNKLQLGPAGTSPDSSLTSGGMPEQVSAAVTTAVGGWGEWDTSGWGHAGPGRDNAHA
ncbi:hypothetical protein WISP_49402 [Willisornis vidua]|uniref:Uncharacterized protein n=1 Tax=Willisornis vidua TaxID=1566151 RepID=A0ABQ9DIP4_9PASS|nr:hypothetical protein WISP_49402 [Willisornis vidua]